MSELRATVATECLYEQNVYCCANNKVNLIQFWASGYQIIVPKEQKLVIIISNRHHTTLFFHACTSRSDTGTHSLSVQSYAPCSLHTYNKPGERKNKNNKILTGIRNIR